MVEPYQNQFYSFWQIGTIFPLFFWATCIWPVPILTNNVWQCGRLSSALSYNGLEFFKQCMHFHILIKGVNQARKWKVGPFSSSTTMTNKLGFFVRQSRMSHRRCWQLSYHLVIVVIRAIILFTICYACDIFLLQYVFFLLIF